MENTEQTQLFEKEITGEVKDLNLSDAETAAKVGASDDVDEFLNFLTKKTDKDDLGQPDRATGDNSQQPEQSPEQESEASKTAAKPAPTLKITQSDLREDKKKGLAKAKALLGTFNFVDGFAVDFIGSALTDAEREKYKLKEDKINELSLLWADVIDDYETRTKKEFLSPIASAILTTGSTYIIKNVSLGIANSKRKKQIVNTKSFTDAIDKDAKETFNKYVKNNTERDYTEKPKRTYNKSGLYSKK